MIKTTLNFVATMNLVLSDGMAPAQLITRTTEQHKDSNFYNPGKFSAGDGAGDCPPGKPIKNLPAIGGEVSKIIKKCYSALTSNSTSVSFPWPKSTFAL